MKTNTKLGGEKEVPTAGPPSGLETHAHQGNGATPPQPPKPAKPSIALSAAKLRMDPSGQTSIARKLLTRVAVITRPNPQWWVQAHPDPEFQMNGLGLIEYNRDRRIYAVDPIFSEELKRFYRLHYVFVGCTMTGAVFLWCIKMAGEDGDWNQWPASMYDCALAGMRDWVQVVSTGSGYEPVPPDTNKPPPPWEDYLYPCTTFDEVFSLGFRQTYLDRDEHPVINDLRCCR
jgi:hypothetical protein